MDFSKVTLFEAAKKKLQWLTQRQEVLAQNIANADTPGYRAHDLKGYQFRELVRREKMQVNMAVTDSNQLPGARRRIRDFADEKTRVPFETAPAGNNVVLEEQMAKVNESGIKHRLTTELYKKHLGMFKMALGRNQ